MMRKYLTLAASCARLDLAGDSEAVARIIYEAACDGEKGRMLLVTTLIDLMRLLAEETSVDLDQWLGDTLLAAARRDAGDPDVAGA